jgi:hypothetical protein
MFYKKDFYHRYCITKTIRTSWALGNAEIHMNQFIFIEKIQVTKKKKSCNPNETLYVLMHMFAIIYYNHKRVMVEYVLMHMFT